MKVVYILRKIPLTELEHPPARAVRTLSSPNFMVFPFDAILIDPINSGEYGLVIDGNVDQYPPA